MFKIEMPTKDIPSDPANLSPALAAMFAQIMMPNQYATVMQAAIESVNSQCKAIVRRIDK